MIGATARRVGMLAALAAGGTLLFASPGWAAPSWSFGPATVAIPFPAGGAVTAPTSEPRMLQLKDGRLLLGAQFQDYDCQPKPQPDTSGAFPCLWASSNLGATFTEIGGGMQASDDVDLAEPAPGTLVESFMSNFGTGNGVGGASVSRSLDDGRTWSSGTGGDDVNLQAINDRPFLLALPGGKLLLSYTAPPGNIFASESSDRGATWGAPEVVTPLPPQPGLSINGEPVYDAARGETVLSYAYSDTPALGLNLGRGDVNHIGIARRKNGSATWTVESAVSLPSMRGILGLVSLAADAAGHEYLTFPAVTGTAADGVGVFLTRSDQDGRWTAPVRVDPGGGSGMLASVRAAGDRGVAVAYYGSPAADARTNAAPWTVRVAVSRDLGASFVPAQVSPRVAYYGPQSTEQGHIFDLLAFVIDTGGFMNIAWTEDPYVKGALTDQNSVLFARQASGPPLFS